MEFLILAGGAARAPISLAAAETAGAGLQINLFWVVVSSLNFLVFAALLWALFGKTVSGILGERRARIEQGMRDAELAREARENAEKERLAAIQEARREANEIIGRAQKVSQETREADIAATRAELDRLRDRATADIEAEKQRALSDLRAEVADLAMSAAGKIVGESMTGDRQRRMVQEFLRESEAESAGTESKS